MSQRSFQDFVGQFRFVPVLEGYFATELEWFTFDHQGKCVPRAPEFLTAMNNAPYGKKGVWTSELSAAQAESRTCPQNHIDMVRRELTQNRLNAQLVISRNKLRMELKCMEVGPEDIATTVYPDPRYLEIAMELPEEVLRAACRVAGTHIHYGMRDMTQALRVYNLFVNHLEELLELGDGSQGERRRLYALMARDPIPKRFESVEHMHETAEKDDWATNPRNNYSWIRISIHGTVELRMFGATDNTDEIISWIIRGQEIIRDAE